MAKPVAPEAAVEVYGYLKELGLAKIYRDVRIRQIYEGASDIRRTAIIRSL